MPRARHVRTAVAGALAAAALGLATAPAEAATGDVVFSRLTGPEATQNYDIWTMAADGTRQLRLTTNAVADHDPKWSPDGARILWVRYESRFDTGPSDVWVMNADGTGKRRLTRESALIGRPTWSPDGSRIVFAKDSASR